MSTGGLEVFLVSATPGLNEALSAYEGVNIGSGAIDFAARLITSDRPPQVVYIEDSASRNIDDLWSFIQAARARQVTVLIGLQGIGLNRMADFVDAGLPITDGRGAHEISAWIGGQLGVRKRAAVQQTVIAVAGAKGGIGKTVVVSSWRRASSGAACACWCSTGTCRTPVSCRPSAFRQVSQPTCISRRMGLMPGLLRTCGATSTSMRPRASTSCSAASRRSTRLTCSASSGWR